GRAECTMRMEGGRRTCRQPQRMPDSGSHRSVACMKVAVEKQPGSISKLQIELPADEFEKEWDASANSFARYAKIPGYRPGKAPRAVIDKRFRKEIQDELTKKLVSRSYHEAVEQEQLRVA